MALRPRACDEQVLSWGQLGDGDLRKHFPSGRQHVADVGGAHLKTRRSKGQVVYTPGSILQVLEIK